MKYIDTHSHTAWGVDDGIQTFEEAQKALQMASEDGFETILSTPHIIPGKTNPEILEQIQKRQDELGALASSYGISIFKGGEVMLNSYFFDALREGWLPKINSGPYMLVEYNVRYDYHFQNLDNDPLFELSVAGIHPVIAHVERYFHQKLDMDVINDWADSGYVFQINATSLLGLDTKQSKKNAWFLIENGYAHTIATDTHRTGGSRIPCLSDAFAQVEKRMGSEAARLLFYDNPKAVIEGKPVQYIPVRKKKSFRFFGR